jgi:hypothetical protein
MPITRKGPPRTFEETVDQVTALMDQMTTEERQQTTQMIWQRMPPPPPQKTREEKIAEVETLLQQMSKEEKRQVIQQLDPYKPDTAAIRFAMIRQTQDVYLLLDSGATENFINLSYAKWLQLPIKQLEQPRQLINVDGTENKAGALKFFTDLQV